MALMSFRNGSLVRTVNACITAVTFSFTLLSALCWMHLFLNNAHHLIPGGESKMPSVTRWVEAFIPEGSFLGLPSAVVFVVGVCWLGFYEKPTLLTMIQRVIIAFAFTGLVASALPLRHYIQALRIEPDTIPPIEFVDEVFWLLLCSLPLIAAILKHRQSKRPGMSTSD